MTQDKLLPCPFCGGAMRNEHDHLRHVEQGKCPIGAYAWGGHDAVEKWNRRALRPMPGFDATELDMIRHGDRLGPELGQRVADALTATPMPGDAGDLASDERWNAGVNYAIERLCEVFGVDPKSISWDAATETVDGDVMSVLCNVLRAAYGDEWSSQERDTAAIRSALTTPPAREISEAEHPDDIAVDQFAGVMKAKLKWEREERARSGWQKMSAEELSRLLVEHMPKGDPVDVANFCMMLSLNRQRIVVPTDEAEVERATVRVCPERDGRCPHGVSCPFAIDRYRCDIAASRAALEAARSPS
jgi:hypothetical protein